MLNRIFFALTIIFTSLCTNATVLQKIDRATVTITNTSPSTLDTAFQTGMTNVLVKMSGNQHIATLPNIQNALQQAKELVSSYHIIRDTTDASKPITKIQINYDSQAMVKLLKQTGQAIWSANRPLTLVWLEANSASGTDTIASGDDTDLTHAALKTAKQRGIPIIFPLMDIQDQSFDNTDISLFKRDFSNILKRYNADAILIGQANLVDNNWQIQWHYTYNQQPTDWTNTEPNINLAAADGINQIADMLANQLAIMDDNNLLNNYQINVSNINNLTDYALLIKLIKGIPVINATTISDLNNSTVSLQVSSAASSTDLDHDIRNIQQLHATAQPNDNASTTLSYTWGDGANSSTTKKVPTAINATGP